VPSPLNITPAAVQPMDCRRSEVRIVLQAKTPRRNRNPTAEYDQLRNPVTNHRLHPARANCESLVRLYTRSSLCTIRAPASAALGCWGQLDTNTHNSALLACDVCFSWFAVRQSAVATWGAGYTVHGGLGQSRIRIYRRSYMSWEVRLAC
jgi:hypothetical protein